MLLALVSSVDAHSGARCIVGIDEGKMNQGPVTKKRRTECQILLDDQREREDDQIVIAARKEGDELVEEVEVKFQERLVGVKVLVGTMAKTLKSCIEVSCGRIAGGGVADPTQERDLIADAFLPLARELMDGPHLKKELRSAMKEVLVVPSRPEYDVDFFCKWAFDGVMPVPTPP